MRTLVERLGELDAADFRVRGRTKHKASEIACMTICAQIAGATSFYDMHSYATEKLGWFRGFLKLENGVPSHDTFRRFWKHSAPARLNSIFMEWVDETCELADGDGIHIDGKCLRRAVTKLGKQPCIVSAYSSNERIVIGQVKADEKSNEITAIPNLIDTLYLMGCIVTIDAAGCQRKIVRKIVDKHADYLISLKGNQSTMHDEISELFETKFSDRDTRFKTYEAMQKGHGRVTKRTCCQTDYLEWFADRGKWAGLASVVMIDTECLKQKTGTRFARSGQYLSVQQPASSETGRWLLNAAPLEHFGQRPLIRCTGRLTWSSTRTIRGRGRDSRRRTSRSCGISSST